jgi:hypothetical protein
MRNVHSTLSQGNLLRNVHLEWSERNGRIILRRILGDIGCEIGYRWNKRN